MLNNMYNIKIVGMTNKEQILNLRSQGKSYNEIKNILKISKATVSYHCKSMKINKPIDGIEKFFSVENITNLNDFYKNHTIKETAHKFGISRTTVIKYADAKRILLSDEQKKINNYQRVKNRTREIKRMGVEYLGGKCVVCGYDKCIWALDFHHRNPNEKEFSIGNYGCKSWNKIKLELDKCDLLCANCHREEHFSRRNIL